MSLLINETQLRDLLSKTFDEGWHGYKDLKESFIDQMISEVKSVRTQINSFPKLVHPPSSDNHQMSIGNYVIGIDWSTDNASNISMGVGQIGDFIVNQEDQQAQYQLFTSSNN